MNVIELHDQVWKALQGRRSRLPHALLLIGQKGIGKYELARAYAKSLLCEQPLEGGRECGQCLACNWFEQGNHPDFRLLQPEALSDEIEVEEGKKKPSQQITIEQIRNLDEFFTVGTHRGGLRVIVVNPAEAMNKNTANSILKTLEEPPPDTLFLMVSGEPNRLLPTIRSRCQVIPVAVPAAPRAAAFLAGQGVADPERWLALAGGAPMLAADLANSGQGGWIDPLLRHLKDARQINVLGAAAELDKAIRDSKGKLLLKHIVEAFQKWLIDLNLCRNSLQARYFLGEQRTLAGLAAMIPPERLISAYRASVGLRQEAEQPVNGKLFLEAMFLDYRALFAT